MNSQIHQATETEKHFQSDSRARLWFFSTSVFCFEIRCLTTLVHREYSHAHNPAAAFYFHVLVYVSDTAVYISSWLLLSGGRDNVFHQARDIVKDAKCFYSVSLWSLSPPTLSLYIVFYLFKAELWIVYQSMEI